LLSWPINFVKNCRVPTLLACSINSSGPETEREYFRQKELISHGLTAGVIVCQDFSRFESETGTRFQVLILARYSHDPDAVDGLDRKYRLFVGPEETTNDVYFVMGAWEELAKEEFFGPAGNNVYIWSDGGRKHFKQTPNLVFMSAYQAHHLQWTFKYNFFGSCHGDGICDGLAAHGKKALRKWEKDVRFVHDHFDLVEVLSTVPDFQVSVAKPLNLQHSWPAFATMQGCCKWFYKYEFPSDGKIKAYECSVDATAKKEQRDLSSFGNRAIIQTSKSKIIKNNVT
jgi:hypothetical protein